MATKFQWRMFFKSMKALLFKSSIAEPSDTCCPELVVEQVNTWLKSIDELQGIARKSQAELAKDTVSTFDWALLGAATYLYHIDRLCVKSREQMISLRHILQFSGKQNGVFARIETLQAIQSSRDCYESSQTLIKLLNSLPKNRLHCEVLVNQIHAFELESVSASSAVRNLTQLIYAQESSALNVWHEPVLYTPNHGGALIAPEKSLHEHDSLVYQSRKTLHQQLGHIHHEQKAFLKLLYDHYTVLSKCYIIKRKSVVEQALADYQQSLDQILAKIIPSSALFIEFQAELVQIFLVLESLRFCANHSSRCSENLASKAHVAMKDFKKHCYEHDDGKCFINQLMAQRQQLHLAKK